MFIIPIIGFDSEDIVYKSPTEIKLMLDDIFTQTPKVIKVKKIVKKK